MRPIRLLRRRLLRGPTAVLPPLLAAAAFCAPQALAQGFGGTVTDILVRGDILLSQGKPNEAIVQYQDARTLCPTPGESVHSYRGEAQGQLALGQLLPAAGLLEEAVTRFPDDPRVADLLYSAGTACQKAGEIDRAIDLLQRALERSPTPDIAPGIKFRLAQSLRTRGNRQAEAIEVLKGFETDYPNSPLVPTALYTTAIAYHDVRNLEQSEAIYRSLIERFPRTQAAVEAHFEMGLVLTERRRRREAAEYYQKYVMLYPASPVAAAALERAADLLLLGSPAKSRELYALAEVKAKANPAPGPADPGLSSWLPVKKATAGALSRVWVVALAGLLFVGVAALVVRRVLRLRRERRQDRPEPALGA
jgi:tetratricopeptide (TPR) repeat protein